MNRSTTSTRFIEEAFSLTTSEERLEELSKSHFVSIREIVAANQNTPERILRSLSKDKSPCVRQCGNS